MMSFISTATMQFSYFDLQLKHPDWQHKKVLDFGGNIGNILTDPDCTIAPKNYWCLDVSHAAIKEGQAKYPEANFIFYDRYNFSFNPTGKENLPMPDMKQQFDIIISYSIFSHTGRQEMLDTVADLRSLLAPGGVLIFTYLDPDFVPASLRLGYRESSNFEARVRRLNGGKLKPELIERNRSANWSVLLNEEDLYIENENFKSYLTEERHTFFSFFKSDYLQQLYPDATLLAPPLEVYDPQYVAEMQHSCILRKEMD